LVAVLKAKDAFSPDPTFLVADFLALTELLKKYLALFLCMTSKMVAPITKRNIATTYVCITKDGMKVPISENGFIEIIIFSFIKLYYKYIFFKLNALHFRACNCRRNLP
jgi:hypothetical protein